MWYVYMLECFDGSLYTGITNDLKARVRVHNDKKGGKYTRSRTPVRLVFSRRCRSKNTALKIEIKIKKLTREKKQDIIKNGKI